MCLSFKQEAGRKITTHWVICDHIFPYHKQHTTMLWPMYCTVHSCHSLLCARLAASACNIDCYLLCINNWGLFFLPPDLHVPIVHPQDLARFFMEVTVLITELENLRKEKADLLGEVEAHKSRVKRSHVTTSHIHTLLATQVAWLKLYCHSHSTIDPFGRASPSFQ